MGASPTTPAPRQHLPQLHTLLLPTPSQKQQGTFPPLLLGLRFCIPPLWILFMALVLEKWGWRMVLIQGCTYLTRADRGVQMATVGHLGWGSQRVEPWLVPSWEAQPQGKERGESCGCIAGALRALPKDSMEGHLGTRIMQGCGADGNMSASPVWGREQPQHLSPLPAMFLLHSQLWRWLPFGADTHPTTGWESCPNSHPGQGTGLDLLCPWLWQKKGSVQQLKHVPKVTGPGVVVAEHP